MKTATLAELREIRGKTQEQVARSMKTSQSMVSQIEGKSDMKLSTLRRYVEALGCELELYARFGDVEYRLHIPRNPR